MPNADYMIAIEDKRFPKTWVDWSERVMVHLAVTPTLYESDYISNFDFQVYTPIAPPEKEIPRRIYQALSKMRCTTLEVMYIGYDTEYAPYYQIGSVLTQFMERRKRFDYEINATSAFALTNSLNNEFLDYPIPRLNIIAVTFLGTKDFL